MGNGFWKKVIHKWHHIHTLQLASSADTAWPIKHKQLSLYQFLHWTSPGPHPHSIYSEVSLEVKTSAYAVHFLLRRWALIDKKNSGYKKLAVNWPNETNVAGSTENQCSTPAASKLFKSSSTEKPHLHFKVFVLWINSVTQEGQNVPTSTTAISQLFFTPPEYWLQVLQSLPLSALFTSTNQKLFKLRQRAWGVTVLLVF